MKNNYSKTWKDYQPKSPLINDLAGGLVLILLIAGLVFIASLAPIN